MGREFKGERPCARVTQRQTERRQDNEAGWPGFNGAWIHNFTFAPEKEIKKEVDDTAGL